MLFFFFSSCREDKQNPFGLENNHITYSLASGSERVYDASCTLKPLDKGYQLSIQGSEGSDGLIATIKNIKTLSPQVLKFGKNVNVIVNEKLGKDLNIYVTSGCKENLGSFEIVEWDKSNRTISGFFAGTVCTHGIFAHLPSTKINDGAFYKLKYHVK